MGTQENKAVVSRFMNEVTTGRNIDPDLIDELLAPNYVNLAMPDAGLAAFKSPLENSGGAWLSGARLAGEAAGHHDDHCPVDVGLVVGG